MPSPTGLQILTNLTCCFLKVFNCNTLTIISWFFLGKMVFSGLASTAGANPSQAQ